jgi:hypothetical protein
MEVMNCLAKFGIRVNFYIIWYIIRKTWRCYRPRRSSGESRLNGKFRHVPVVEQGMLTDIVSIDDGCQEPPSMVRVTSSPSFHRN